MRGATAARYTLPSTKTGFNPRAPCGARLSNIVRELVDMGFNPRAPCGARQARPRDSHRATRVSIHAPHAGRDKCISLDGYLVPVSIHAPHAGRDPCWRSCTARHPCFNPRAPCGARPHGEMYCLKGDVFQSTRPMRGATFHPSPKLSAQEFQSTRPMRGATGRNAAICASRSVSIHAPHAGRDSFSSFASRLFACFNPRAPCGARHAAASRRPRCACFNPRAPCGARRGGRAAAYRIRSFQSTRPMRGATAAGMITHRTAAVSIHAPHAGRDRRPMRNTQTISSFNPRAPCGARHTTSTPSASMCAVSIHAPHAGRDSTSATRGFPLSSFNPRAPCGARPLTYWKKGDTECFNPRAPCGARPCARAWAYADAPFQSTRPMRGATLAPLLHCLRIYVSIHAPHAGRDTILTFPASAAAVSIHAPHAGRDAFCYMEEGDLLCFNPRAPCGARLLSATCRVNYTGFNPRAPCGARRSS